MNEWKEEDRERIKTTKFIEVRPSLLLESEAIVKLRDDKHEKEMRKVRYQGKQIYWLYELPEKIRVLRDILERQVLPSFAHIELLSNIK